MNTAAAAELEIRSGTADDTARILELVKLSLGEGKIPREQAYWNWKHHENPFGASPMLLAEAAGELVGLRVFMRWEWRAGGDTFRAVRAVDTATHPKWQGKGIFSSLTRALVEQMRDEGVAFIFNTPNDQSRPGYLKMGWSSVGRTSLWIRPLRPLKIGWALLRRGRGSTAVNIAHAAPQGVFPSAGEVLARPDVLPFLASGISNADERRFATLRSAEYLRWRYGAIPGFQYHALAEFDQGAGALVIFRYKEQGPLVELRVCDLLLGSSPRSQRIGRGLLSRLRRESGADYISAMGGPGSAEGRVLLRSGFLPAPRLGPILTVRPLDESRKGPDPLSLGNWRLSIGDLELF